MSCVIASVSFAIEIITMESHTIQILDLIDPLSHRPWLYMILKTSHTTWKISIQFYSRIYMRQPSHRQWLYIIMEKIAHYLKAPSWVIEAEKTTSHSVQKLQRAHKLGSVVSVDLEIGGKNCLLPAQYCINDRIILQVLKPFLVSQALFQSFSNFLTVWVSCQSATQVLQ